MKAFTFMLTPLTYIHVGNVNKIKSINYVVRRRHTNKTFALIFGKITFDFKYRISSLIYLGLDLFLRVDAYMDVGSRATQEQLPR